MVVFAPRPNPPAALLVLVMPPKVNAAAGVEVAAATPPKLKPVAAGADVVAAGAPNPKAGGAVVAAGAVAVAAVPATAAVGLPPKEKPLEAAVDAIGVPVKIIMHDLDK